MSDVLIIGGGPIGLAAAIEARLAGMSVALIEPRLGTIDKACSESLLPGAVPMLHRLGVDPLGMPLRGIAFHGAVDEEWRVEHRFATGVGLGVRRTSLHDALTRRAAELGITRGYGRLQGLHQDEHSVTAFTDLGETMMAKWVLGCDGLRSSTARLVGLTAPPPRKEPRYGIRQHFEIEPWTDLVELHYAADAEVNVTPVAPSIVDVTVMGPRGVAYNSTLRTIPALRARLANAPAASAPKGAGPFRQRTFARTAGRVLLVGDASGYVDALAGEGLRLGFAQARAAIEAITRGRPSDYEREWQRVTRPFNLVTTGLVSWAGSSMRAGRSPVASSIPRVFGAVVERLAH
jgi:flavin-dependent dehydrogenase